MEKTDAAVSDDVSMKVDMQVKATASDTASKTDEDPLKFAPIYGPTITSPQQYIPKGYCLLECDRCGGVDGMQIGINICVYCADKKSTMTNEDADEKAKLSKTRGDQ